MTSLTCLTCGVPMTHRVYDGIEYEQCAACDANWFDAGELGLILRSAGLDFHEGALRRQVALPSTCRFCQTEHADGEYRCRRCQRALGLQCPRDGRPMLIASVEALELDLCPHCGGIWLDGEEFNRLLGWLQQRRAPGEELPEWVAPLEGALEAACQRCGATVPMSECSWSDGVLRCRACQEGESLPPGERPRRRHKLLEGETVEMPAWLQEFALRLG
jgi:Zn-finger nucleic acid-binding protein